MRPEGLVCLCSTGHWKILSSMMTEHGVSEALTVQDVTQLATVARLWQTFSCMFLHPEVGNSRGLSVCLCFTCQTDKSKIKRGAKA